MSLRRSVVVNTLMSLAAASLLLVAGCQAPSAPSRPSGPSAIPVSLEGTSWRLVEARIGDSDKDGTKPDRFQLYTLTFYSGNHVSLHLACNDGGGTWTGGPPPAGFLKFTRIGMTLVGCKEPLGWLFYQDINRVRSFEIRESRLILALDPSGVRPRFGPVSKYKSYVWERSR